VRNSTEAIGFAASKDSFQRRQPRTCVKNHVSGHGAIINFIVRAHGRFVMGLAVPISHEASPVVTRHDAGIVVATKHTRGEATIRKTVGIVNGGVELKPATQIEFEPCCHRSRESHRQGRTRTKTTGALCRASDSPVEWSTHVLVAPCEKSVSHLRPVRAPNSNTLSVRLRRHIRHSPGRHRVRSNVDSVLY